MLPADVTRILTPPPGGLLLVAVGNTLRGDDALGPIVASLVRERPGLEVLDAGERPEDALDAAVGRRPERVVVLDAADFGGSPGEVRLLDWEAIVDHTLSTHRFPLPALARLIGQETGAAVYCVGVQAAEVAPGAEMSGEVRRAAEELAATLNEGE